jgi:hypothetical protein
MSGKGCYETKPRGSPGGVRAVRRKPVSAACQRRMAEALHEGISPAECSRRLVEEQAILRQAFLEPHVSEALCAVGEEALFWAMNRN